MAPMADVVIDNRGLVPPEPMIRILTALASLPEGDTLVARMDREPMPLYAELERRGFAYEFQPGEVDGAVLRMRKADA